MGRKNHKTENCTCTIADAAGDYSGIDELREQMQSWQSSLEDNSMEHLPKYEEVEAAATILEDAYNELESACTELESTVENMHLRNVTLSYTMMVPYKGRSEPRWMSLANATAQLRALVEYVAEIPEADEGEDDAEDDATDDKAKAKPDAKPDAKTKAEAAVSDDGDEDDPEEIDSVREFAGTISEQLDELDAVEFPGMFG